MTDTRNVNNIEVRLASWIGDNAQMCNIRTQVFVHEQQVPRAEEIDSLDPVAQHFLAFREQQPVATGRLLKSGQIGRMAVLKQARGYGVGGLLLQFIVDHALSRGQTELFLHAQVHAIDFYRKYNFVEQGELFWEAGIEHRTMTLRKFH